MKTVSMISCFIIMIAGIVTCITKDFFAGAIMILIGGLSLLIIAQKTEKISGYNPKHWMNR